MPRGWPADLPAHLNPQLSWADITGIGVLGAIGFTVSLLIADLSYTSNAQPTDAKGAILLASGTASLAAALILGRRNRHHRLIQRRRDQTARTTTRQRSPGPHR